jgi:hypothetical protein
VLALVEHPFNDRREPPSPPQEDRG